MSPIDADLAEELLAAYRQLCESRNYDAAFHILMAVLHVADRGEDMALVDRQTPVFRTLGAHAQSIKARWRVGARPQPASAFKK
jgi:hypothetical protein